MSAVFNEADLIASVCKESFWEFVKEFWEEVPGAGKMKSNWHMEYLANQLQEIAERVFLGLPRLYHKIANISPGTSKSSIASILFHAWVWTRMPTARFLTASHTDNLVLDLANKARTVIKSEKYRTCFPDVEISESQDTKGYFTNTKGGDRYTCTVAGKSPMGFHAHFIICLPPEALIETENGKVPIGELVHQFLPVRVMAYDHDNNCRVWAEIEGYETSAGAGREMCRVVFEDGTNLEATADHPVYICHRGYVPAGSVRQWDQVICAQGGTKTVKEVLSVPAPPSVYNIRVKNHHNYFADGVLVHNCDDPIDPKKAVSEVELNIAEEFMTNVVPTRMVDKEVTVIFLIMQRLHERDPTGVMLDKAKNPDSPRVDQIKIPANLDFDVYPENLKDNYTDGLMDPVRLNAKVLKEQMALLGAYGFAGQYGQNPTPRAGGMFEKSYFRLRASAAPFKAKRIRYWDRASSLSGGSRTAGVLMCKDMEGKCYVEHAHVGQWNPDQRNNEMLKMAMRDRARYGTSPSNEPTIYIEREGGSSGRDAWLGIARKLAGFRVREDRVTGDKVTRAESWSCQLAAGTVWMVEDGTWDLSDYIHEHELFPKGTFLDQVDASSGAFNLLFGAKGIRGPLLQTLPFQKANRKGKLRIILATRKSLPTLVLDEPALLLLVDNPAPVGDSTLPRHGLHNLLTTQRLPFLDTDLDKHQETWDQAVVPYNKPAAELVFTRELGKAVWRNVLKKWDPPLQVIVVVAEDRRGMTLALGLCDVLRQKRQECLYDLDNPDWVPDQQVTPPLPALYELVKTCRALVVY